MSNILFVDNLYFDVFVSLLWYYKRQHPKEKITFIAKVNRHENYFINECELWLTHHLVARCYRGQRLEVTWTARFSANFSTSFPACRLSLQAPSMSFLACPSGWPAVAARWASSRLVSLLTGSLTLPSSPMVSPTVTNLSTLSEMAFPSRCKRDYYYSSSELSPV